MPYTLSHVAAVVPFARPLARLRVLSAAVIGSMVPDFHYLLPIGPPRFATHTLPALVTFCLPVGLVAYWGFQWLIKRPLVSVLPDAAYVRWLPYATPAPMASLRQWLIAAAGILVGAVTHLAWDAFTHEDARGVRMVPELADRVVVHGHLLSGARVLQDLSSLFGLALVLLAIVHTLRAGEPSSPGPARALNARQRRTWVGIYALTTLVSGAAFLWLDHPRYGGLSIQLGGMSIALLRALAASAVVFSVLVQVWIATRRNRS